jgi:hypothetical protein
MGHLKEVGFRAALPSAKLAYWAALFQALETIQSENYRTTLGSIRNQGRSQAFVDLVPGNAGLYVEP